MKERPKKKGGGGGTKEGTNRPVNPETVGGTSVPLHSVKLSGEPKNMEGKRKKIGKREKRFRRRFRRK